MSHSLLTALIVDDEKRNTSNLNQLINRYCPELQVVGIAHSGMEGEAHIRELSPQVVFLDIQMPEMNGFQLLDRVRDCSFHLVFVTAYEEYALQAIKENALDYLLKPISIEELKTVVRKIPRKDQNASISPELIQNLLSQLNQPSQKITFSTLKGMVVEELDNLVRVESDNNYTTAYLRNGEKIILSRSIKEFERTLQDDRFFRIHNSHLIQLEEIKTFSKQDGGYVILKNGTHLPVSRRKISALEDLLKNRYKSI